MYTCLHACNSNAGNRSHIDSVQSPLRCAWKVVVMSTGHGQVVSYSTVLLPACIAIVEAIATLQCDMRGDGLLRFDWSARSAAPKAIRCLCQVVTGP